MAVNPTPDVKSARPTNKWIVAVVTACAAVLVSGLTTGFGTDEAVQAVGVLVTAVSTYFVPNDNTPGGVPLR